MFFYGVKRQKAPATDMIYCKHENGLKLSITNPVRLYQRSQMFAVSVEVWAYLLIKRDRVTEFLFESVF